MDKGKCIFFQCLNDLFSFMRTNHIFEFDIWDDEELNEHINGNNSSSMVVFAYGLKNKVVVSSTLFDKQYFEFLEHYREMILDQIKSGVKLIRIPDFVVDENLIDLLKQYREMLSETEFEIINYENFKFLGWFIGELTALRLNITKEGKKIDFGYVLGYPEELWKNAEGSVFNVNINLKDDELKHFLDVGEKSKIHLPPDVCELDEKRYLERLLHIFEILSSHNRQYNIEIDIKNRELLKKSGLLDFSSINLTIRTYNEVYSKKEFLDEDVVLEELVRPIREANLSPFERYLAAYNIVKKYKAYQKDPDDSKISRHLKYVLDKENKYIVCVGYANLLMALLNKLGIACYTISFDVDVSKDRKFKEGSSPLEGHMRNIVKIDDNKYGIHGVYESDATWDNFVDDFYYNCAVMTFDRIKEFQRLETLIDEDLLLDFHNSNDFYDKIKYFLVRSVRSLRNSHQSHCQSYGKLEAFDEEKAYVSAFRGLYIRILEILVRLDYNMYVKLYGKYNLIICDVISKYGNDTSTFDEVLGVFAKFLTEYEAYIVPLSNRVISEETLYTAIMNVKREVGGYDEEELQEYIDGIKIINDRKAEDEFPYVFNPNDSGSTYLFDLKNSANSSRPNYLESRNKR